MYNDTQKTQGGLISVDKHRKKVLNGYAKRGMTGDMPKETSTAFTIAILVICIIVAFALASIYIMYQ